MAIQFRMVHQDLAMAVNPATDPFFGYIALGSIDKCVEGVHLFVAQRVINNTT